MDVRPCVRDVFAAQLDGNVEGVPSWEQFGEKLLNMDTVHLRQFKSSASPTKAILNSKIAVDPSATLEDAFEALEAIERNDVTVLVLQKLELREGSIDRTSSPSSSNLLHDQRAHHMDHVTDRDTVVTAQVSTYVDQAPEQTLPTTTVQFPPAPPTQASLEKAIRNNSFDQAPGVY